MAAAFGRVTLALLAACSLMACSAAVPTFVDARDAWTRDAQVWEGMESRLLVDATLKNAHFRTQYVLEYARLFAMTKGQQAALLEAEMADEAEYHVVVASIFVADRHWDRLDPKHGIWDVRLQDDAERWVRPVEIKRLNTDNPLWKRLYPYIDRHDGFYELRFPRTLDDGTPIASPGQNLHLVIAGAPAQVKLTWPSP
jgi:hypothetical protein